MKRFLISLTAGALMAPAWVSAEPQHGLAMNGTPKYAAGFTHFEYVNPDAPKGGEIRLHSLGGFDSFNGFIAKGEPADGLGLIYDTLMVSSDDEAFTEYGLVADSIETPEDRSWVIFHLNPEARFHDGTLITVDDVMFTFNTLVEQGAPFYKSYYGEVDRMEDLGDRRIKFHFKEGVVNRELPLILGQLPVLPKHWWADRDFSKAGLEPPLGSGPYRIKDFEPGKSVTYERVPDYWAQNLPVARGSSNFDEVRYDYFRDDTVALEAFKAGEYDFRQENTSKLWGTMYTGERFDKEQIIKAEISHELPRGMQGFGYNLRRELFQDRRVREALGYAFDFEWSNKNLFYGQYRRSNSFFTNSELASRGKPTPEELAILEPFRKDLPEEVFTEAFTVPQTDGSGNLRTQLRQASRLLNEAGWTVQDGKRVNAAGQPFEFEILLVSPAFERIVLPFAKNLERLGITANVRTVDTSQYIERLRKFDFDMMVVTLGQSLSPGNEQHEFWSCEAAQAEGSRNYMGICNPAIDELIKLVIAAPNREELITRTRALDRALLWNHFVIPQWHINYFRLGYWNKFSHPEVTPKYGLGLFTWWVDPAKEAQLKDSGVGLKSLP